MKKQLLTSLGAAGCALGIALATPAAAAAAGGTGTGTEARAETWSFQASLDPITANKVTGNGASWISVTGTSAEVKMQVNGLLDGAPHAQHIHIGAAGVCPTAADAKDHNGFPSITVADGLPAYGGIGASLTVEGDTAPAAGLHVGSFPSAGSYTYARTIQLDRAVVDNLAAGTAVVVVHGIDYNGNGQYDGVLGASELDPMLPAEATNPALCGTFVPMQMAGVPAGAADTGGGSTAVDERGGRLVTGSVAGIAAVALAVAVLRRRRPQE